MSDAVQMPPLMLVVPRVAPVHAAEHVEPPKKPQTGNRESRDRRNDGEADLPKAALSASERHLRIMHDDAAKTFVYRSVEAETGDVVWQWPTQQILRRAAYAHEAETQQRHEVDQKA
jgi:hypothetical protein